MPDLSTTVDLIFRGVDNATTSIDNVLGGLDRYNKQVNQMATPLANVTKSLVAMEAAAISLAALFAKQAYDASIKFTSAQTQLAKVMDESEGDVSQFNNRVFELAEQYGVLSPIVLASAADFRQSGFTTAESLDLVEVALRAVVAGEVEAAEASSQLRAILAAFKGDAEDAATVLDLVNEASNRYNASFDELLIAVQRFSPIAAGANLSFQETLAVLVPVVEVFQRGELAATGLSSIFNQLQSDQSRVVDTLTALGVAQKDANGDLREQKDIYFDLLPALAGVSDAQRSFFLGQLAGLEQAPKLREAYSGLSTTNEILSDSFQFVGSAAEETNRVIEGAPKAADKARVAFDNFLTQFGLRYQDDVKEFNDALTGIFQSLRQAADSGDLDVITDQISSFLDILTERAEQLAKVLPEALKQADLSSFADGVSVLIGDFGEFEITADNVAGLIEKVGEGFQKLSVFTRGVIDVVSGFVAVGAELVDILLSIDDDAVKVAGAIGGLALVFTTLSGPVSAIITLLRGFIGLVSGAGGLVAALGPAGGLAAAAGLVGFSFGELLNKTTGVTGAIVDFAAEVTGLADEERRLLAPTKEVVDAQDDLLEKAKALRAEYEDLSVAREDVTTGEANLAKSFEETGKATNLSRAEFEKLSQQLEINRKIQGVVTDAVLSTSAALIPTTGAWRDYVRVLDENGDITIRAAEEGEKLGEVLYENNQALDDGRIVINRFYGALDDGSAIAKTTKETRSLEEQLDAAAKSGELAKDKFFELRTELEKEEIRARVEFDIAELENNTEVVKSQIQGVVDLAQIKASVDISEIEAGVAKTEAVLLGLQNVFDVTGASIGTLVDAIVGVDDADKFARQKIEIFQDALDRQITLQESALESQIKVNDATIEELRARARRLRSGEALITINADGMEPELRAVFLRVIELAQIEANADGGAFLLGL